MGGPSPTVLAIALGSKEIVVQCLTISRNNFTEAQMRALVGHRHTPACAESPRPSALAVLTQFYKSHRERSLLFPEVLPNRIEFGPLWRQMSQGVEKTRLASFEVFHELAGR
jgi:hypothetical protein